MRNPSSGLVKVPEVVINNSFFLSWLGIWGCSPPGSFPETCLPGTVHCAVRVRMGCFAAEQNPGTQIKLLFTKVQNPRKLLLLLFQSMQCVQKGPQLRTWSSWGPNCQNCPHLVLILYKRPHLPQFWYILGLESVFLYDKWRNREISTSILLYMDLVGNGIYNSCTIMIIWAFVTKCVML